MITSLLLILMAIASAFFIIASIRRITGEMVCMGVIMILCATDLHHHHVVEDNKTIIIKLDKIDAHLDQIDKYLHNR